MTLTNRQTIILDWMSDGEEAVVDGIMAWVGDEQISVRTVHALLRVTAIKDVSDVKGLQRYVINDAGLAILERPELADEITIALFARKNFTIKNNHIELMP